MAANAKKKLVVAGGNGFLGSRICKAASARGWDVTSISRSGEPNWSSVTSSPNAPPWSRSVTWAKADILKPSTYTHLLTSADAVVHSMGILFEADYKGVLQGKEPIWSGMSRAFSATKKGTQDPLASSASSIKSYRTNSTATEGLEDLYPQETDGQLTYEVMNRDSAVALAKYASAKRVSSFAYISAAAGAPILPQRYITTKREAEETIASRFPAMRSLFIRPGMLYDSSRGITVGLAGVTGIAAAVNGLTGGRLTWLMGAGGTKPLKADVVAEAVVEGLDDESVDGVIEVPKIESLANTAWRKGML